MVVRVGTSGDDQLTGTSGDDILIGKGGDDDIEGKGGNDIIIGGAGLDSLKGGAGDDILLDFRTGGSVSPDIGSASPGPGNDLVFGGPLIFDSSGNDVIIGASDNDLVDAIDDPVSTGPSGGHDVFVNINPESEDNILTGAFSDSQELENSKQQIGNSTLLTLGSDNTILLVGVPPDQVTFQDFIFDSFGFSP